MELKRILKGVNLRPASQAANTLKKVVSVLENDFECLPHNISAKSVQEGFTNFYNSNAVSPHIAMMGYGPWTVNETGKIVYDTGGYGMLGFGHNPDHVLDAMSKKQVMANIMTPSMAQHRFWNLLRKELEPQYSSIICLNSGSEANTHAMNMANRHTHENAVRVSMKGSFHGRTEGPASVSGSCQKGYEAHLANYNPKHGKTGLVGKTYWVNPNDPEDAYKVFKTIAERGEFPELTIFEPVMGEGNPGVMIEREHYEALRELSAKAGGLLMADSVQAGWRCTGELSFTRYPTMEGIAPPDMESFSKAINGGQFPLSVLALSPSLGENYTTGLYGNTMTSNPRALDVGTAVLEMMTPDVRENIRTSGLAFKERLQTISDRYPTICDGVTGTGLLVALHLKAEHGVMPIELDLRLKGLNVIHGGENALRFTPWFNLSNEEIEMLAGMLESHFDEMLSESDTVSESA